jgi:hypothetical protein
MKRFTFARVPRLALLALIATVLMALAPPASAQEGQASVDLNTWLCPEGYDQHSDCEKIGGVTVQVTADAAPIGEITSVPDAPASIAVPVGSAVELTITGGQPDGTTLDSTALSFTAVEGSNPVTLVFVEPAAVELIDSDGDGLSDDDETAGGTDPQLADTDGDGVQDGAEVNAGTDPLVADTDGDGFTDGEELDLGSDPLDPASFPQGTEPNEFNIQAFNCPPGHEGKATPDICTEPATGVEFTVYIPGSEFAVTQETDANGVAAFGNLGSGTFVLRENFDDLDLAVTRYSAMCVGNNVPGVPEARQINYTDLGGGEYQFELTQGEIITCGWYNLLAADDDQPVTTPTPVPTQAPVTRLPSTGTGDATAGESTVIVPLLAVAATLVLLAVAAAFRRRRA